MGSIKDKFLPSVYGVGIVGCQPTAIERKALKEYKLWQSMLQRCYDTKQHVKHPTYSSCSVSENFKYFPYFKDWCNKQVGFGLVDEKGNAFTLDKDILIKGNKVYSEDTCVFVPFEINSVVIKRHKKRGDNVIGVCYQKSKRRFISQMSMQGKHKLLGYFQDEMSAFLAYKKAKETYIKELADKWKDHIDIRVYNVLMNYQVEITD